MRYRLLASATALLAPLLAFWLVDPLFNARIFLRVDDLVTHAFELLPLAYRLASVIDLGLDQTHWIPDGYTVVLSEGHSLADHKAAVRWAMNLDGSIKEVFETVSPRGTLFYTARGVGDTVLRAIKTDRGVSFVQRTLHPRLSGEKAPLHNADLESRIAGAYCVFLGPGYFLEQHKAVLRTTVDLDNYASRVFDDMKPGHVLYCVENLDEVALDAIRLDFGVQMVECD